MALNACLKFIHTLAGENQTKSVVWEEKTQWRIHGGARDLDSPTPPELQQFVLVYKNNLNYRTYVCNLLPKNITLDVSPLSKQYDTLVVGSD